METQMEKAMVMVNEEIRDEITSTMLNSVSDLDLTLRQMSLPEQAVFVRDGMRSNLSIVALISEALMVYIWKVIKDGLWAVPISYGDDGKPVRYSNHREWIDNEVGATFNKRKSKLKPAPALMQDVVRVAERIFPYVMTNSVRTKDGEPITPEYLIHDVGFGGLKVVSNHFKDNKQTPERDQIIFDLATQPVSYLRETYSKPRIPVINYALNIAPTGASDIIMTGLSPTQVELIRSSLGRMVREHAIHISEADRYALLTQLLTPDMQNTYDVEGDE